MYTFKLEFFILIWNGLAIYLKSSQLVFMNNGGQVSWDLSALPTALLVSLPFCEAADSAAALQVQLPHFAAFVALSGLLLQVRLTGTEKSPRRSNFWPTASGTQSPPTPDALFPLTISPEALPCAGSHTGGVVFWPSRPRPKLSTCCHLGPTGRRL